MLYLALEDNQRRLKDRLKRTLDAAYGGNWRGRDGIANPAYGREALERGVVLSTECTCDRSVARPCWAVVHEGVWSDHEEA